MRFKNIIPQKSSHPTKDKQGIGEPGDHEKKNPVKKKNVV